MKKTSVLETSRPGLTARRGALLLGCCSLLVPGSGCREGSTPLAALETRLAGASGPRQALEVAEAIKCRRLLSRLRRAGATPHALPELDSVPIPPLGEGDALLSLMAGGGRLRRFLARDRSVEELPSRELHELEALVARTRDELELGDDLRGGSLHTLLERAGRALLDGVPSRTVRRLLVLPDGVVRALPFAALLHDGQPLVARLELASAPCLALVRPALPLPAASVLAPGPLLPGAAEESAAVAAAFPDRVRVEQGSQAGPRRFEEALARPGLVHFAGHGLADRSPSPTAKQPALRGGLQVRLLFPDDDGEVDVRGATRLRAAAGLVVLAACATAEVARFRDGLTLLAGVSMPEALLAAGARRVVAASWAVKDRRSASQMRAFYAGLPSLGAAASLARAQRAAREAFTPPHPRFWAFYAVYGGF